MNIELKILHLHHALRYVPTKLPSSMDYEALSGLVSQCGECLLAFKEDSLFDTTDDGPALSSVPLPDAAYSATQSMTDQETEAFLLSPGDYVFFQWRTHNAGTEAEVPSVSTLLEEVAREIWWQGTTCRGRWFLRLVPEDDRVAFQILRRMQD